MPQRAVILSCGAALPRKLVRNADLPADLETSDEWIRERTGILQRYIAGEGETTASLATHAASDALGEQIDPESIDVIILSTSTPDAVMPSSACLVQAEIGANRAAAFDLNAACSGFVYGLNLSQALLTSGQAKRVLLIGAETMSRIVDWSDRRSCILFGDGAGAMILEAQHESTQPATQAAGILACMMLSDGRFSSILQTDGGISSTRQVGLLAMQGREVFRHAVDKMSEAIVCTLEQAGLTLDQLDWIVPHQANWRIMQAIAKKIGVSESRCISTVSHHANTSAASIPLAFTQSYRDSCFKKGDIIAFPALGAGLTWGCCIIKL